MENLNDLCQEFITKALGDDIKVSNDVALEFYYFCEENNCIPTKLKELSSKIESVFAFNDRFYDRFCKFCQDKEPENIKDVRDLLLSYSDLCESEGFIWRMKYYCKGKYFHHLNIECSLKFVRFWLLAKGLVSKKTFQELEAQGIEKSVIDELKQINKENKYLPCF